jgi:hypothetical protein
VVTLFVTGLAIATLPTGSLAPSVEAALEACQACEGSQDGRCDDSPLSAEDHCCPSSCQAHSVWTLTAEVSSPAPFDSERTPEADSESPLKPAPRDIAQPPQV